MPEDTEPQSRVHEPILSPASDPEPSTPSAVPVLPLLPARHDAHSLLISVIQNLGVIFYFLHPRLSSTPYE